MLADSDKYADGLRVFKSGNQVTFQGAIDTVAESRQIGTFVPIDFGSVPREFGVLGGEITVALLNGVKLPLAILDTVGIAKGVLENLYQGGQVGEVNSVVFHVRGDLIQGFVLEAVD